MNRELEANTMLSHYRMVAKIGAGGMGEVYLAQDTKLDRKVAIKFLHDELSKDADKLNRFVQEAKAASALNHPNILTVHEIGEVDGKNYIATELIDGQTLREHLSQQEPLSLNTILKIGVQVAEALSAAHQAGIIHRDIKPENIMIRRDGYAKVLDFGLAKLSEPHALAGGSMTDEEAQTRVKHQTHPGTIMGTASYMSPEQARGKQTDARTDIWSLGVVLYEMLARKVPFTGETVNHIIVSILEKEPLLLTDVPRELQRIIRKALTKDADMRYQSARDLLIDLKNLRRDLDIQGEIERSVVPNRELSTTLIKENQTQLSTAASIGATKSGSALPTQNVQPSSSSLEYAVTQAKSHKLATAIIGLLLLVVISVAVWTFYYRGSGSRQINSIAVLPFENRSGTTETDYLSDGLADSLIYRLSQLPNLKVSPTSSVMRYKGRETDVAQIAKELEVDAVMSGRLVQRGDELSISVQLIDSRSRKLIWAEQYDRKMADLLATQREIATTITQKLQLKLAGVESKGITKKYTDHNEAYQLYLKGRYHFAKRTKDDVLKSIEYFQQAIKLDPNFALAYARIAEAYNQMPNYPYLSPKEAFPRAKMAALRAQEIDPTLSEAHAALGNTLTSYDWNWTDAESSFKRAVELDPTSASAHYRYATEYLIAVGRNDEAIAEVKRALEIEPLDLNMQANLARVYLWGRHHDLALEQAKKAHDLEPSFVIGRLVLGLVYNGNAMYEDAIRLSETSLQTNPGSQHMLLIGGYAYAKTGRRQEAEQVVRKFREIEKSQYVVHGFIAAILGALGDKEKAFAELDKAIEQRDSWIKWIKSDPMFDPLRDDPRFKEMLKRMNLPE